ncbi:MAG TPA: DUF4349 domain-containing protein [Actinomycetota bacterium]|nr:DUF4349 domain-containing protein [Actinomycetota bacterium]
MFHSYGKGGRAGRVGAIAFAMLIAGGLAACGGDEGGDDSASSSGGGSGARELGHEAARGEALQGALEQSSSGDQGGSADLWGSASAVPSIGASVIKTADVRVEVPGEDLLRESIQKVEQTAGRYGGFVLSTSVDNARSSGGVVVIRIPSEDFELALRDVKGVGDVTGENVSGKDVSQEFIDLEARIRNLEAQEAILLQLMEKATTIAETINVQNNLSGIQLEIERLRGRLNFLEDRTSLGTISVAIVESGAPAPREANVFSQAWNTAVEILEGIGAGAIILTIGVLLPLSVVAAVAFLIFKALKPRLSS